MRRGEIYYAELGPTTVGSEINKTRPVLIVSCDANNRAASTVTVLPIISNVSRVYAFEIALSPKDSGLPKPSKVQAQQIRTISRERVRGGPLARLSVSLMQFADDAVRLHLDL
ncbi:MAG TPA: type II toxin-antitoxin system PemK/MazF family toxin [Candidatus Binataceae bacterium]|nr:type II toxin-antitoxin system PemK/MazF family toxin [Candidatus Binataceae bacterium]